MEMQLNEREASLLDAFRRLHPETATELSTLAERLAELAPNRRIDWSDSWSDEDLNEFSKQTNKQNKTKQNKTKQNNGVKRTISLVVARTIRGDDPQWPGEQDEPRWH